MTLPAIIAEKLAAFKRLEPEVEASFQYVQEVHGERCFPSVPVEATVRYLHALWVCECKDCLLSVPKAIDRFEGRHCLALLRRWQETGETAEVVAFVQRKLDPLDFASMTRRLEEERQRDGQSARARRLAHGRIVLLNRGMNLLHALDSLFVLPEQQLREDVRAACARYAHAPGQIEEQLRQLETAPYACVRHPALAQRNIVLMHRLGVRVTADLANRPGNRTWRAVEPTMPEGPYAEEVIGGYVALTAPRHNNPKEVRWVDRLEVPASQLTGRR
jgi:hypothetical protein